MPWIAVDKELGVLYEGTVGYGRLVAPTPTTAPAAITSEAKYPPPLPPWYATEAIEILFREDSFDAVTRARRGRLYTVGHVRPETWRVSHPSGQFDNRGVYPFQSLHVPSHLKKLELSGRPLLAIGSDENFGAWTIVSIEGTSTGEFLLTLRGRQTYGALPELIATAIPAACQGAVVAAVTKLGDEIFRAGPGSVTDRARDAASAALSGYLQDIGAIGPGRDLADLVKAMNALPDPQRRRIAGAAAEIVRILHSREKPSVQERLPVQAVREQEAELAVSCVGAILVELGWAKWS